MKFIGSPSDLPLKFKVRKELGLVYRSDGVHRLQFNDYQILDEEVDAIAEIHLTAS